MNIKDLAIGAVAGAALAIAGTLYVGGSAATPGGEPAGAAAAPQPAPAPEALAAASTAGPGHAPPAPPVGAGPACPPSMAEMDPRRPLPPPGPGGPGAPRVEAPAITLSTEHAKLLMQEERPLSLPERHARFASEALDPAWSQQTEALLRQSLQEAGVQKGFELLAVECRQTMCELRAFGSGPEASQRWNAIAAQLGKQWWWSQNFSGTSTSSNDVNDRAVIATILQRTRR